MRYEAGFVLSTLRQFARTPQLGILQLIKFNTVDSGEEETILARSTMSKATGFSELTCKRNLDKLCDEGLVIRRMVCANCGAGLGMRHADVTTLICPHCGGWLGRKVWTVVKLSQRGKALSINISVPPSYNTDTASAVPQDHHYRWAEMAARVLGVGRPIDILALAKLRREDMVRSEADYEVALALAAEGKRRHGTAIFNLRRLIESYMVQVDSAKADAGHTSPVELDPIAKGMILFHIEGAASAKTDADRLFHVLGVEEYRNEYSAHASAIDAMVEDHGLLPRILTRNKVVNGGQHLWHIQSQKPPNKLASRQVG